MKNIKDVAREAGVSAGTVSKVLKGYRSISEATREKVLNAVDRLGYIPNSAASTLSSKGTKKIGIYLNINDKFQQIDEINMLYVMGALDRCRELGVENLIISDESLRSVRYEDYRSYFSSLSIDGIIVFGLNKNDEGMLKMLQDKRFKFAVIDASFIDDNISHITVDQQQAQYDVARQVVEPGDRVLYLAGKENSFIADWRQTGIERLQKEMGFDLKIVRCDFSEAKAFAAAEEFVDEYDCVVCASDLMAIGVRQACKRMGKRVRIAGFDGIRLLGYVSSSIITVKQDFYQFGYRAVDEIMALREGNPGREVLLPYEIGHIHYRSVIK